MRSSANHSARERYLLYFVVAVGLVLRLTLHFRGCNFDVISYRIVLQIMRDGGNVYQDTVRYNYGPVWFNILHLLDITPPLSLPPMDAFRWKLVLLLTAADMGIFVFLLRHYSLRIAALFFLNPISIIITGYHNQFDNIAVFVGLLAVFLYQKGDRKNRVLGMLGMGLSLCLKHLLFLFPVWLALKEKKWSWRVLVVLVPYAMFLLSFLPYWSTGAAGINVKWPVLNLRRSRIWL